MNARWLALSLAFLSLPAWAAPLRLGAVTLTDHTDRDVVNLPPCAGPDNVAVTELQLRVSAHPAQIDHLVVTYADGNEQTLALKMHFAVGDTSRWIDLNGPARCVRQIRVVGDADTIRRTPNKQAVVAFWGDAVVAADMEAPAPEADGGLQGEQAVVGRLVGLVVEQPPATQHAEDPGADLLDQAGHVGVGEARRLVEDRLLGRRVPDVPPVEHQQVEVEVEVQRGAEVLVEAHRARSHIVISRGAGTASVPAKEDPDDHGEDRPPQLGAPGEPQAQRHGKRQDPLPDRDVRQHPVDQVGGGLVHAATAAGGAEPSALARERHHDAVVALGTGQPGDPKAGIPHAR